ncbi:MAG: MBL fold metallo-hydrolase [Parvibaculaceae bacterium]
MPERNPYYQGPPSDHFDGVRFFVPRHDIRATAQDLRRWRQERDRRPWPKMVRNGSFPPPSERLADGLSVTFIGHATALIQTAGLNILTDPFFSRRASPTQLAGPTRARPPGVALADLPPIDVVLVSHNHYDHMDLPAIRRLHDAHGPRILTPLGNAAILRRARRRLNVTEGDWEQSFAVGNNVTVTLTPAVHWSKRGLHDDNMALWCAFRIEGPSGSVYFAADTGYGTGEHFRAIRRRFGPPDLALLPIGAYEPRWFMRPRHMCPDDAVKAHLDLGAGSSVAIHHGTLQLTDEGMDEPAAVLDTALKAYGVEEGAFRVLEAGESWRPFEKVRIEEAPRQRRKA